MPLYPVAACQIPSSVGRITLKILAATPSSFQSQWVWQWGFSSGQFRVRPLHDFAWGQCIWFCLSNPFDQFRQWSSNSQLCPGTRQFTCWMPHHCRPQRKWIKNLAIGTMDSVGMQPCYTVLFPVQSHTTKCSRYGSKCAESKSIASICIQSEWRGLQVFIFPVKVKKNEDNTEVILTAWKTFSISCELSLIKWIKINRNGVKWQVGFVSCLPNFAKWLIITS